MDIDGTHVCRAVGRQRAHGAGRCITCVGDCNGDGSVTVEEIITMVNMALGNAEMSDCDIGDANNDNLITVDEILMAVNNALNCCPLIPEQGCLTSGGTVTTATCCTGPAGPPALRTGLYPSFALLDTRRSGLVHAVPEPRALPWANELPPLQG